MLAFVKILKKFDKVSNLQLSGRAVFPSFHEYSQHRFCLCFQVTNKQVLPIYLKVVESSYFNSSDKVNLQSKKLQYLV